MDERSRQSERRPVGHLGDIEVLIFTDSTSHKVIRYMRSYKRRVKSTTWEVFAWALKHRCCQKEDREFETQMRRICHGSKSYPFKVTQGHV